MNTSSSTFSIPQGVTAMVAVASGKGGVGKSTTAACLARELHGLGKATGLLDVDILGPSISTMTSAYTLTSQKDTDNAVTLTPPIIEGVKVASAGMLQASHKASILRGPMASRFALELLSSVSWGKLDYLILDYPPGTGDIPLSLAQHLTNAYACIVTTPQRLAYQEAEKTIDMFQQLSVPIAGIIETMSYFEPKPDERYYLFGKDGGKHLAQKYSLPLLGQIPFAISCQKIADGGMILKNQGGDHLEVVQAYRQASENMISSMEPSEHDPSSLSLKWSASLSTPP
ncbi:MAG: P-loop NTPase [Proteobacteria bacterium]|nr:P-loop NTPase [Pseudomonadota bacterium]